MDAGLVSISYWASSRFPENPFFRHGGRREALFSTIFRLIYPHMKIISHSSLTLSSEELSFAVITARSISVTLPVVYPRRSGTQLQRDAWKEIFMSNYFVRDAPLWDESYLYRNAISKVSTSESLGLTPR